MHCDWSVHKLLEGRDVLIKRLIATVSFAVEQQKPIGEMLPDFLVVRGASMASKHTFFMMPRTTYDQALSMEAP